MSVRQIRIFVRSDEPVDDWAETLIGRICIPLTDEFSDTLSWYWFSRYGSFISGDSGDCNIDLIPDEYKQPLQSDGEPFHRSIRFRFNINDDREIEFEERLSWLITENEYGISGCLDYDYIGDTGSNRFLGIENRQSWRAEQRALLATEFFGAISRLVIDALVGPDANGRFNLETNDDLNQNPRGSSFSNDD